MLVKMCSMKVTHCRLFHIVIILGFVQGVGLASRILIHWLGSFNEGLFILVKLLVLSNQGLLNISAAKSMHVKCVG